ncbi:hypothetical protein V6N13_080461 [Hibiscus sabdariffa]
MLESTAKIGRKNRGNMKADEELDKLLDEIPHATSPHHHVHQQHDNSHVNRSSSFHGMCLVHDDDISSHYYKHNTCTSPVSGLSLQSDGSSSSLFSNNGSQTPPFEDLKPHLSNGLFLEFDPSVRRKASSDSSLMCEMGLFRNLSKMYISNDQENVGSSFRDFYLESNGVRVNDRIDVENYGACEKPGKGFSDVVGIQSPVPMSVPLSFNGGMNMAFSGLPQQDALISQLGINCWNGATMRSPWQKKEPACSYHRGGVSVSNLSSSLSKLSVNDALIYGQRNCPSWNEGRGELNFHGSPRFIQTSPKSVLPLSNGMTRSHSNVKMPHGCQAVEDSYIIQGEGLNYVINKGPGYARAQNKGSLQEIGASKCLERAQIGAACGSAKNAKLYSPFSLPPKYNSLAEARGYIYLIAKDQHGCRFLQRLFDDGTRQDVQMIFKEIIDHVVELMMNPFGNYLIQKLLEVCNEEQRMQILLMVTEEPGKLVKISLNTHGTRVVQKLIETLKTRQQISLVTSALAPGFLSLIKDLNGNHVVQRCLQCLSSEDNNFGYVLIVIAFLHSHSTGEYKKKLLEEISANGLLLAQDAYGNYVVQFTLELKIPSATSTLTSQFEGNYVHLSLQKFSSHVVEKCLIVLTDDGRSRVIRELLSATHFEQLLQDPHANYVVQTAVRVSEGPLHNSLVEAIESRKAISRNSPYSKRIFSQKLLKNEGIADWKNSLVGQFIGAAPNFLALKKIVDSLWGKNTLARVSLAGSNLYVFSFANASARDWVLENGPWHIQHKPLVLLTATRERLEFAKVCIEVAAGAQIPRTIPVKMSGKSIVIVKVKIPWMPPCCSKCCMFGHSDSWCTERIGDKVPEQVTEKPPVSGFEWRVKSGKTGDKVPEQVTEKPPVGIGSVSGAGSSSYGQEDVVGEVVLVQEVCDEEPPVLVGSVAISNEEFPPLQSHSPTARSGKDRGRKGNAGFVGFKNKFEVLNNVDLKDPGVPRKPCVASLGVAALLNELKAKKVGKVKGSESSSTVGMTNLQ